MTGPGEIAEGPLGMHLYGGVVAEGEGQHHCQHPDAHYHRPGGFGREPWLQRMDDGHVSAQEQAHIYTSRSEVRASRHVKT